MSERYEIQEKIGQGGIGAVYRAYDTQLKRSVAIKRMLPSEQEANGPSSVEMMLKEATTLSALQHPNIITVYDVGIDDDGPFVVMELLKGETLDLVIQRGVLTMRDFGEVVSQTMEALIAAEAAGVLHRDLKPTNVMVNWLPSKKFQVKILDFSLAKFSRTPAPQTIDQGDAIFGSIYFMAPEQFERGNLDKRTDLYSMGCLYYFCLSGQYPFQGDSAAQVMASHLQGTVVPLEQIRSDLPPVICQWVMWLINRYADDRPQDSKEAFENYQNLTAAIDPSTNRVPLSGQHSATPGQSPRRRARSKRDWRTVWPRER
jgi:serine/threonine protein kinase